MTAAAATRYRAIRKIAEGGSAEVFLAEQLGAAGFKRMVVLKRIRAELYADGDYREQLLEEAQLAMKLHHSNLVEVVDLGEAQGHYFLVLELVDGWTLVQLIRRARDAGLPIPPSIAVYIAAEICRGLAYAHERAEAGVPLRIVHRDICPNNVLLSTQAEVKLIDFGIARAATRLQRTGFGRTKGKPAWMSPEQAMGEHLDGRSDLFSVGSVLFALLTDTPPFHAASDMETLTAVTECKPEFGVLDRPGIPTALKQLVQKALSFKREDRFQSAQEMLMALEDLHRTVLTPAGRSELDTYLRLLSTRDGDRAITGQTMPPVAIDPMQPIALSHEQTAALAAPRPRRRRWRWFLAAAAIAALAVYFEGSASWWPRPPEPASTLIYPDTGDVFVATAAPDDERDDEISSEWKVFPSHTRESPLQISARVAPKQRARGLVAVVVESKPPGAVIKVDDREAGRTPATINLQNGRAYELSIEAKERSPVVQTLTLTPKASGAAVRLSPLPSRGDSGEASDPTP